MASPVNTTLACALSVSSTLLIVGCQSSGDGRPAPLAEKAPGGSDASMLTTPDASAEDASGDIYDASIDRSMISRELLPTAVNNLLLDPFITSDVSWGHFRAVVPAVDPAETGADCPNLTREFLSASPIGISAPVVLVNTAVLPASMGCTAITAPFVGSTEAVSAQIWVSLSDGSGAPLPFPPAPGAGGASIDTFLAVALLPNVLPDAAPPASYPFSVASTPPTSISGRQWGLLELATPVSLPEGGWFAITLKNPTGGLFLAAPQIVPAATTTQSITVPLGAVQSRPMTEVERGAILQYGRLLARPAPPRRRPRPQRTQSTGP